jgi:hypothetical protein
MAALKYNMPAVCHSKTHTLEFRTHSKRKRTHRKHSQRRTAHTENATSSEVVSHQKMVVPTGVAKRHFVKRRVYELLGMTIWWSVVSWHVELAAVAVGHFEGLL